MSETKKQIDEILREFVYHRAWIGACQVSWGGKEFPMKLRLIAYQETPPTESQRKSLLTFIQTKAGILLNCKSLLQPYCERVYGEQCHDKAVEDYLVPVTGVFEEDGTFGFLFKCRFEDEINLAVKFVGDSAEVGTDDILL